MKQRFLHVFRVLKSTNQSKSTHDTYFYTHLFNVGVAENTLLRTPRRTRLHTATDLTTYTSLQVHLCTHTTSCTHHFAHTTRNLRCTRT